MAGVAWYGPYAGRKPGDDFSGYGSRGFSRSYLAVARAYDVARNAEWLPLMLHYAQMATRTPARDPRGFIIGWSGSSPGGARDAAGDKALMDKIIQDERIQIVATSASIRNTASISPRAWGPGRRR